MDRAIELLELQKKEIEDSISEPLEEIQEITEEIEGLRNVQLGRHAEAADPQPEPPKPQKRKPKKGEPTPAWLNDKVDVKRAQGYLGGKGFGIVTRILTDNPDSTPALIRKLAEDHWRIKVNSAHISMILAGMCKVGRVTINPDDADKIKGIRYRLTDTGEKCSIHLGANSSEVRMN